MNTIVNADASIMMISEKEFLVIQEIYYNPRPDQRMIASRAGISLGLTNLIIKRLLANGYIKATQLDRKKIQYTLTPKGFSKKTRKSYNYTIKTVSLIKQFKEKFQKLIMKNYKEGMDTFEIAGNNELADILEIAVNSISLPKLKYNRTKTTPIDDNNIYLIASSSTKPQKHIINATKYLAEENLKY
ncbi:MAG: hypothetical protein A3J83_07405 [Elusimicrobia bacterium RIFOXYA2_FULL_40_6]|nr:MAG: hypothetical protein A3J83_07405 [Elusimicrobia bacterium RIFOXYA2_FULL_40_6]